MYAPICWRFACRPPMSWGMRPAAGSYRAHAKAPDGHNAPWRLQAFPLAGPLARPSTLPAERYETQSATVTVPLFIGRAHGSGAGDALSLPCHISAITRRAISTSRGAYKSTAVLLYVPDVFVTAAQLVAPFRVMYAACLFGCVQLLTTGASLLFDCNLLCFFFIFIRITSCHHVLSRCQL